MKVFACNDHAGVWVGAASVVVARDEIAARAALDAELHARKLADSKLQPFTLREIAVDTPQVVVLQDGDY